MEDATVVLEALIIAPEDEIRFLMRIEVTARIAIHHMRLSKYRDHGAYNFTYLH